MRARRAGSRALRVPCAREWTSHHAPSTVAPPARRSFGSPRRASSSARLRKWRYEQPERAPMSDFLEQVIAERRADAMTSERRTLEVDLVRDARDNVWTRATKEGTADQLV